MRRFVILLLLLLTASTVFFESVPRIAGFTRVGALNLNSGENNLVSSVIDTAGGYAYFGTYTSPGIVVKVRLSDFTRVAALTLNAGENLLTSAVLDTAGGYVYFGTGTSPGIVVKVRLSNFTRVGALTLNTGENFLYSGVIDASGGFAYFVALTSPGIVVKVRLSDFTRISALILNFGENQPFSTLIDTAGGYAYLGTSTSPGIVVKVRLSDLTRVGALTLNAGENSLVTGVIDTAGGYSYFGTVTSPGIIVKVRLSDFSRVGALTLNTGENQLLSGSGVVDVAGGFAYFGTQTSPSILVKIRLSDLTRTSALTLNSLDGIPQAAVLDASGYAYFGMFTSPGTVVKVQVASAPSAPIGLVAAGGAKRVNLTWSPPSSNGDRAVLGYKIYRGTLSGSETLLSTIGNQTYYSDTSPLSGATYYYKVTDFTNFGESLQSNEASAATTAVPTAPLNLQAIGGAGQVSLTWKAPASNGGSPVTGYNIYRGASVGSEALLNYIGNLTSYTDGPIGPVVTYYYKVTAVSAVGESGFSSEAIATTRSSVVATPTFPSVLSTLAVTIMTITAARLILRRNC